MLPGSKRLNIIIIRYKLESSMDWALWLRVGKVPRIAAAQDKRWQEGSQLIQVVN